MKPSPLALLLALAFAAAPASAQNELVVPVSEAFEALLKTPPPSGGWAQAVSWELKPLPRLASAGAPPVTKVWAAACSKGLLLAVSCPKGAHGSEDAKVRDPARDADVFRDPSVEVFLWPTSSDKEYYQFAVGMGSRGAFTDARFNEGTSGADALKWNAEGASVHVVSTPPGWTAALLVPWSDLGLRGRPMTGYVLRAKVVRNMPGEATTYRWPLGTAESHHAAQDFGYLVIRDKNLVENGDFEDPGRTEAEAEGWLCPNDLVDGKPAGTIARTQEAAHAGKAGMRMVREAVNTHLPQLNREVEVQADSAYRISCWARGEGQLYLRWTVRGEKLGTFVNLTPEWSEHSEVFDVPEGVTKIGIGAQLKGPGRYDLDEVRLVRENAKDAGPELEAAHPLHRLLAAACQRPFVPFGWLSSDGTTDLQPLFVKDSATGHWLVRWARAARHRYSDMPPFNANGTFVAFNTAWKEKSLWIADLATGRARQAPIYSSRWVWDRNDPDRLYAATGGNAVQVIRASDNRASILATFDGAPGLSNISWDGKLLIVQVDHAEGKKTTSEAVWIRVDDGKTIAKYDFKKQVHAIFFTKHPSNSIAAALEDQSDPDAAKGYVVTPEGKVTRVVFPGGHLSWEPGGEGIAFFGGGAFVCKADGSGMRRVMPYTSQHIEWNVTPDWFLTSAPRGIFRIWPSTPPKWERVAVPNSDLFGNRSYYTENHVAASPDGTSCAYASQMLGTGDFYAAVIEPPMSPVNLRREKAPGGGAALLKWDKPERAREIVDWQVYALDGEDKVHALATTKGATQAVVPKEWAEADLFVTGLQSWGLEGRPSERVDATGGLQPVPEAAFATRFAPVAVKGAPRLVRKDSSSAEISWEAVKTSGFWHYRVHRAPKSDFVPSEENLVGTPREPTFLDWGIPATGPWNWKVVVVARNGAASTPSEGLSVSLDRPAKRVFVEASLNWKSAEKESVEVPVTLPAAGRCVVWLRVATGKSQRAAPIDFSLDGVAIEKGAVDFGPVSRGHSGAVPNMPMWQPFVDTAPWAKEEFGRPFPAGNHRLGLRAASASALEVTKLVVTDDLTWAPGELWKMIPPEMAEPKP